MCFFLGFEFVCFFDLRWFFLSNGFFFFLLFGVKKVSKRQRTMEATQPLLNDDGEVLPTTNKPDKYKKVVLEADHVSFSRVGPNPSLPFYQRFFSGPVEQKILDDISAVFRPGEMTAIMGPSGAGKTTFLNVLAARANGAVSGEVMINGRALNRKETRMIMKVVPQDDILIDSLTSYDILSYTYDLLYGLGDENKDKEIYSLLNKLGLAARADVVVGNSLNPGLSGGQKKRCSIALELIANPGLLFLDEPTSGLDSLTAFDLVKMLKGLASTGRNIICTIHQPSYEVFSMFDRLLLLEEGKVAFNGPVEDVVGYFKECGYDCPMYHNPADFVFEAMATEKKKGASNFAQKWQAKMKGLAAKSFDQQGIYLPSPLVDSWNENVPSSTSRFVLNQGDAGNAPATFSKRRDSLFSNSIALLEEEDFDYQTSWLVQFYVLFRRGVYMTFADKKQFRGRMLAITGVALFFGLVYFQLEATQQTAQDRVSVLFSMLMFTGMNMMMMTVMMFPLEREIVTREYQNGTYPVSAYYCARLLASWFFQCIYSSFYLVILYFMVGFILELERFLVTFLTVFLIGCLSVTLGMLIGAWIPSLQLVTNLVSPVIMPLIVLCGFLIRPDNIPIWFKWLHDVSYFNYSLQMLVHAQFSDLYLGSCIPNLNPDNLTICPLGPSICEDDADTDRFPLHPLYSGVTCVNGTNMILYLGFNDLTVTEDAIILATILLICAFVGGFIMYWRVSRRIG